ncbi:hypothetical protein SAMN02745220_05356 [Desulfopila aestuarii DSM 18488]|uniref:Uncharacterized protein n=1 Tax=Desulfopila aestuarii DSM 18488 TaxID=1121416 RepID=A0A1M7YMK9_9BACT|nr:hypothetical protein SAMN02745220_05356 [Desulfopila aestuarii DSM 18488]
MATVIPRNTRYGIHFLYQARLKGSPSISQTSPLEIGAEKLGEDVEHALRTVLPLPWEEIPLDDKSIRPQPLHYSQ